MHFIIVKMAFFPTKTEFLTHPPKKKPLETKLQHFSLNLRQRELPNGRFRRQLGRIYRADEEFDVPPAGP